DFTVMCWGANTYGQLGQGLTGGNPDTDSRARPTTVPNLTDVARISIGTSDNADSHVGALKNDKTVVCWGANDEGQLGGGAGSTFTPHPTPRPLMQNSTTMVTNVNELSTGKYFTCFIDTGSRAFCVGLNDSGQLGDNSTTPRPFPVQAGTTADYGKIW